MGENPEDLGEYRPMQLTQWGGTGTGFYRNAHAFLHDDFRVAGKDYGAAVKITAQKHTVMIAPLNNRTLYCKNLAGGWEKQDGEKLYRQGEDIRIDKSGPYFRLVDQ